MRKLWTLFAAVSLGACTTLPDHAANAPGMVSAADPRAAEAGASILRQGGSATDAVLATLLALTVVEPQSSGIGGGGFLVTSDARGDVDTFDGRETAPAAAGPSWFLKDGKPMSFEDAVPGGKSVGVPGNVRMMALAHRQHGKLPWAALVQPAIRLARDGFAITQRLNFALARGDDEGFSVAALTTEGRALYFAADGKPLPVGTTIRNPALAAALEQIAARGPDSFYIGPNAQAIATIVRTAPSNPAAMTPGDLAAYDADTRACIDFLTASPHCSGRIGTAGMCLGGHLAFRAALQVEILAAACLYPTDLHKRSLGKGLADDSLERCAAITGELLMIFGRQDPHIPAEGRAAIYQQLTAAERSFEWHEFNAAHAFMRDEGNRYNPSLAATCYALVVELFKRRLA